MWKLFHSKTRTACPRGIPPGNCNSANRARAFGRVFIGGRRPVIQAEKEVSPLKFVCRTQELNSVMEVMESSKGQALTIIGPRGFGKTALLEAAASIYDGPIAVVKGNLMEISWPLSGVSAFLSALDGVHGTSFLAELKGGEVSIKPFELAQNLVSRFHATDVVWCPVFIDDVHRLDELSQQVLGYVIRRMTAAGMHTVLTMDSMAFDGSFSGFPQLTLGPIGTLALIELGRSITPITASYSVLDCVARASSGSPLAFTSMLAELPKTVVDGAAPLSFPMRPGKKLAFLSAERMAALSDDAQRSLHLLACGPHLPEAVFRKLDGASLAGLEELTARDIVARAGEYLVVTDPTLNFTVYWDFPVAERLRTHGSITAACENEHVGLHSWHASFIQLPGEHAPRLLDDAATLVGAGLLNSGVVFAERALALIGGDDVKRQLGQLVKALLLEGEYDLAHRYLHIVRGMFESAELPLEFVALTTILDYIQYQKFSFKSVLLVIAEHTENDPDGCAFLLCVSVLCLLELWDLDAAKTALDELLSLVGSRGEIPAAIVEVYGLYSDAINGGILPDLADLQVVFHVVRKGFGMELARILLARVLALGERYSDAREVLNNVLDQAGNVSRIWVDLARQVELEIEHRSGDFNGTRRVVESLEAAGDATRAFRVNRDLIAAVISMLGGDPSTAMAALQRVQCLVGAGTSPVQDALIAVRQGEIAMTLGDYQEATVQYARAQRIGAGISNPQLLRVQGDYIEALLLTNQRDLAQKVLDELKQAAKLRPSEWARLVVLRCETQMLEDDEDSIRAFATQLETWPNGIYPYLRARTLFSYSEKLNLLGYDRQVAEARRKGLTICKEIGLGSDIESLRDGQPSNRESPILKMLDNREFPVVELLAKGYKNQTIAHELFISVRTVELRLTSVYRKFGVKSRFDLMKIVSGSFVDEKERGTALDTTRITTD